MTTCHTLCERTYGPQLDNTRGTSIFQGKYLGLNVFATTFGIGAPMNNSVVLQVLLNLNDAGHQTVRAVIIRME